MFVNLVVLVKPVLLFRVCVCVGVFFCVCVCVFKNEVTDYALPKNSDNCRYESYEYQR